jgi:hypothetical protein
MKKKLTIGVFLALAVVLVASIVGVSVADAAKPVRFVTATINATPDPEEIGNCSVSVNVVWENYGAWWIDLKWYKDLDSNPVDAVIPRIDPALKRIADGEYHRILGWNDVVATPCQTTYKVEVQLLKRNRSPIPGANASHVVICTCSQ